MKAREIRLAARPVGWPTADTFALAEIDLPDLEDGEALVRNTFMSVDPYMRGRMNDVRSYVPSFEVGRALEGGAIGEVVESRVPELQPGDLVHSMRGWRDAFVAPARELRKLDSTVHPHTAYLGVLGMTGMTAWVGLKLAELRDGDRVFVSGAAGAVGSVAGQLARLRGAFVVGSAGSDDKVRFLRETLGFDAAINYKTASAGDRPAAALRQRLGELAPEGLDVYFDNVGGDHLEAAIACMRPHGRIVACGSISRYNDTAPPPGPRNLFLFVTRRLTMRGFIVSDWASDRKAFVQEVAPLVASGRIQAPETIVEGLERAPQAFLDMMRGVNLGKMIVKI